MPDTPSVQPSKIVNDSAAAGYISVVRVHVRIRMQAREAICRKEELTVKILADEAGRMAGGVVCARSVEGLSVYPGVNCDEPIKSSFFQAFVGGREVINLIDEGQCTRCPCCPWRLPC